MVRTMHMYRVQLPNKLTCPLKEHPLDLGQVGHSGGDSSGRQDSFTLKWPRVSMSSSCAI